MGRAEFPENRFREDLADPKCVQLIYDFALTQVRGLVDYNDEDDVIQEVFYRLTKWPIKAKYHTAAHYFSLLKITVRQAIAAYWKRWHSQRNDVRRRQFVSELSQDQDKTYEFEGDSENVLHRIQIREIIGKLLEKVESLSPRQRAIFQLRFVDEKSHSEIANLLCIGLRTSYRLEAELRLILQEFLRSREWGSEESGCSD